LGVQAAAAAAAAAATAAANSGSCSGNAGGGSGTEGSGVLRKDIVRGEGRPGDGGGQSGSIRRRRTGVTGGRWPDCRGDGGRCIRDVIQMIGTVIGHNTSTGSGFVNCNCCTCTVARSFTSKRTGAGRIVGVMVAWVSVQCHGDGVVCQGKALDSH